MSWSLLWSRPRGLQRDDYAEDNRITPGREKARISPWGSDLLLTLLGACRLIHQWGDSSRGAQLDLSSFAEGNCSHGNSIQDLHLGEYMDTVSLSLCFYLLSGSGNPRYNSTESNGGLPESVVVLINKVKTVSSKLGKCADKDQAKSVIRTWKNGWTQSDSHGVYAGLLTRKTRQSGTGARVHKG